MKISAVTLLISIIAIIAGQQYSVNLSNMRLLQDMETTDSTADDGTMEQESAFTEDPACNDSVSDETLGTYTDGSSGVTCTAETGYDACPCYGKITQEQAEGMFAALGALAALWICLIVCVPITLCCVVGCVVYHCFIKDK